MIKKPWPRSLFGRNFLLLLTVLIIAQVCSSAVIVLALRPRITEGVDLLESHIDMIKATLEGIPQEDRAAYISRLNSYAHVRMFPALDTGEQSPARGFEPQFIDAVRDRLPPGTTVRWTLDPDPRLWVRTLIGGVPYWIVFPDQPAPYRGLILALSATAALTLLAIMTAMLIQRRINRPLRELADAARTVGAGNRPARLPDYGISELSWVANQFNSMAAALQEMEATRAVMLAGISHDIRTPLTKLRLQLALNGLDERAGVGSYLMQIERIITQFVDFGRIGADERCVTGNINTLICQIAGEFEERGNHFKLTLGDIPELSFAPVAMYRVITNLMDNAVKYGGSDLEVVSGRSEDAIYVEVLDRGPGLTAAEIAKVVRPFARGEAARAQASGTGLGLAIADRLIQLRGGRLEVSPRQHRGLRARITLPLNAVTG